MRRPSCLYAKYEHFSLKILQILAIFSVGFFLGVQLLLAANLNDNRPLSSYYLQEFSKCLLQYYRFSVEISVFIDNKCSLLKQNLPNSFKKIKALFEKNRLKYLFL